MSERKQFTIDYGWTTESFWATQAEYDEKIANHKAEQIERHSRNYYTMYEAAEVLTAAYDIGDAMSFMNKRMRPAVESGVLRITAPQDGGPISRRYRPYSDWVTPTAIDEWLALDRFAYRWPVSKTGPKPVPDTDESAQLDFMAWMNSDTQYSSEYVAAQVQYYREAVDKLNKTIQAWEVANAASVDNMNEKVRTIAELELKRNAMAKEALSWESLSQTPATPAPVVAVGASDMQHSEIDDPLLDPLPYVQVCEILGATSVELAQWVCLGELSAWRTTTRRFHEDDLQKPVSAGAAEQTLLTLNLLLSKSQVEAFKVGSVERYVNYKTASGLVKNAVRDTTHEAEILQEWRRLHSTLSDINRSTFDDLPQVAAFVPGNGFAARIEDGLVMESQINIFLKQRCDATTPAFVDDSDDPAPLKKKHRTWRDVAWPYMVDVFKSGQYPTAKEFYRALEKKAGADSPFDRGTGPNSDSLFVREISKKLTFKTVQNTAWAQLKTSR